MPDLDTVIELPSSTCFACGVQRQGVLKPCSACGRRPKTHDELRKAVTAAGYADAGGNGPLSASDARNASPVYRAIHQKALDTALADRQLRELLGLEREPAAKVNETQSPSVAKDRAEMAPNGSISLICNPFYLLGLATSGAVSREPADSLHVGQHTRDPDQMPARSALRDSQRRLHAELRWLGEVSPETARLMVSGKQGGESLEPLARVNLDCHLLSEQASTTVNNIVTVVARAGSTLETIDPDVMMRTLNSARKSAKVELLADAATVADALDERAGEISRLLIAAMDTLPSDQLLDCFEQICEPRRSPDAMVRALVTHYRQFAEPLLLSEGDKVVALCRRGAIHLRNGGELADEFVSRLSSLMALYHRFLTPMRNSTQGLGVVRTLSRLMRDAVGELVDAAQQHADAETSSQLSALSNRYFKRR